MVAVLRKEGLNASRSSVHVNFAPPGFDKFTASCQVIERVLGANPKDLSPYVYVGDSLNDVPMFAGFPNSVGVANIREIWNDLPHRPRYLADKPEGAGLRQVIEHILRSQ
jgi:hydroxymethylpyrimidine pyrophosphatase-like HAD family hydrolase